MSNDVILAGIWGVLFIRFVLFGLKGRGSRVMKRGKRGKRSQGVRGAKITLRGKGSNDHRLQVEQMLPCRGMGIIIWHNYEWARG